MSDFILEIEGLNKYYGANHILKNIDLKVEKGKLISIIGRSGCGKTTLMRCVNFLEMPDSGKIRLGDTAINKDSNPLNKEKLIKKQSEFAYLKYDLLDKTDPQLKQKISVIRNSVGFLFQSLNLFPHKTVMENVTLPLIVVQKKSKKEAEEIAIKNLKKVALENFAKRYPNQLSGGQAQRVGIARELALNPLMMLYDEPTSALDPELVQDFMQIIIELKNEGMTQLVVSHSLKLAKNVSDYILFMENGIIVESGTPDDIFNRPKEEATIKYLSLMSE